MCFECATLNYYYTKSIPNYHTDAFLPNYVNLCYLKKEKNHSLVGECRRDDGGGRPNLLW